MLQAFRRLAVESSIRRAAYSCLAFSPAPVEDATEIVAVSTLPVLPNCGEFCRCSAEVRRTPLGSPLLPYLLRAHELCYGAIVSEAKRMTRR